MLSLDYVAGIIDGEGCIAFETRRERGTLSLRVVVSVNMAHFKIPTLLQAQFGGSIHEKPPKDKRRAQLRWVIVSDQAGEFLKLIQPLLQIKNEQCEVALTYLTLKPGCRQDVINTWFKEKMHKLNERGYFEMEDIE